MKKPKVSIISISYNQEKYIKAALDGFVAQKTDFDFEVVIGDDASSDKTPEIIRQYSEKYSNIFKPVLRKKNIGSVANFLDTLRQAGGEYIAICEGDDYWTDPQKLQTQADFLDKNPDYVGCFHTVKVAYEGNEKEAFVFPEVQDKAWYTTAELLKTNYIPTNSVMYRRQNYDKLASDVMPFDWYFHLYNAQFGKIAFIDKVMSVYRKHKGGIWWEYDVNRDEIWRNHGIPYFTLFTEALKIYSKNPEYKKIIENSINETLSTLAGVDKKYETSLLKEALAKFPEKAGPFMIYQHDKLEEAQREIDELKPELLKVGDHRNTLQHESDRLASELALVTNSRSWRLRTKLTRIIGRGKS